MSWRLQPAAYKFWYPYPPLPAGQKYYWRIDAVDPTGAVIPGDVWSFTMNFTTAWAPKPASGTTYVDPNTVTLEWMAGMNVLQHDVYFGTDRAAVEAGTGGTQKKTSMFGTSYTLPALSRGTKYYRRIDEVEADGATVHKGTIWAFTIPDYLIVDDFEKYTNDSPNRVFQTWVDGYPFSPDEFFPRGGPGDVSGAGVGHDIWTETSPHYQSATMETAIVAPGSKQSMPFDYNNINSPYYSETDRTWDSPQDWTAGGVDTTRIKKMYIGVVDRNNPKPDGHGVLLIDDIRVIKPASGQ